MKTKCPKCNKADSWQHVKECYNKILGNQRDKEERVAIVIRILKEISTENPAKYMASEETFHNEE